MRRLGLGAGLLFMISACSDDSTNRPFVSDAGIADSALSEVPEPDVSLITDGGAPAEDVVSGVDLAANLSANPSVLQLPPSCPGHTGEPTSLRVNAAVAPLGSVAVSVAGPAVLTEDQCTGSTVPAGGECRVLVALRPTQMGPQSGHVRVRAGAEELTVLWESSSVSGHVLAISGSSNFERTPVGATSAERTFLVRFSGSKPYRIDMINITTPEFVLSRDMCRDRDLQPNESCELGVRFRPSGVGLKAAQLTVSGRGAPCESGDIVGIALNGEGQ